MTGKQSNGEVMYPQNLEAERALLGSILIDNAALNMALEHTDPSDFFGEAHRIIFQHMVDLAEKGRVIDLVTLSDNLTSAGLLQRAGGSGYIAGLTDGVPFGAGTNITEYCRIIKDKSVKRQIIYTANSVISQVLEGADDSDELLNVAQAKFFEIAKERVQSGFETIREIIKNDFETLEKLWSSGPTLEGVDTGYRMLDSFTGGWRNGELIILAARPSLGKTALALNASIHLAKKQKGVGFFSLEMSKQALLVRILCSEGKVDSHRLRTGFSSKEDWQKLTAAMGRLVDAPLHIDESFESNMMQLRAKARRLKAEKDVSLIVVDYLQLITPHGRYENRTQEVSSISRSLKGMAKELNVPVLALSQLSRPSEKRNTICPMLSDLRDSGSIEQDADVVIFLYPCREDEDPGVESAAVVNIRVAKQRNGPTGDTKLTFMKRWVKFEDWSPDQNVSFEGERRDGQMAAAGNDA